MDSPFPSLKRSRRGPPPDPSRRGPSLSRPVLLLLLGGVCWYGGLSFAFVAGEWGPFWWSLATALLNGGIVGAIAGLAWLGARVIERLLRR